MSDLWGQRRFQIDPAKAPISGAITHIVDAAGGEVHEIDRTGDYLMVEVEVGEWRARVGRHASRAFVDSDVSVANDTITETGHGYETGDGPLQLVEATGAYVDTGGENITFADADPDTITRSAGSFITDGFTAGMTIQVSGTTNNNGTFTIAAAGVAATVLTLIASDQLTDEGPIAGSGVTITGSSLPRGLSSGVNYWIVVVDDDTFQLAASKSDAMRIKQTGADSATESDAIPVDLVTAGAAAGNSVGGTAGMVETAVDDSADNGVLLSAGDRLVVSGVAVTLVSFSAADALAYWQV
jgi:hypothetical protein